MEIIHTVVFAEKEGGGNPCPVVLGADGLTDSRMQEMTREFRQESAFISPCEKPGCRFKVRYFVPDHELAMCVHATIACVTVLIEKGFLNGQSTVLETKAGEIHVEWERQEGKTLVLVDQFLPEYQEKNPTRQEVCHALRISEKELGDTPVESVSTSRFKLIVPLKEKSTLDQLNPDFEELWNLCDQYDTSGFYPFVVEKRGGACVLHARQFPNRAGYPEDPATGVAASALSAYIIRRQIFPVKEGWNRFTIYQGHAMGRPGILLADAFYDKGKIARTRVCGFAGLREIPAEGLL